MKVYKLGTIVKDKASTTDGMLTHLVIHIGGNLEYIFQPKGLNPKTRAPVERIIVQGARIQNGEELEMDMTYANAILGTQGEDFTGFKGIILNLVYHINGCIHIGIKPEGVSEDTGNTYDPQEFDIRRVKGEAITPLTEEELRKSIVETPSPEGQPLRRIKS